MSERVTKLFLHGRETETSKNTKKKDVKALKRRNKRNSKALKVPEKSRHKSKQFLYQTNGKQTNDSAKKLIKANVKKLHQSVHPRTIRLMKEVSGVVVNVLFY